MKHYQLVISDILISLSALFNQCIIKFFIIVLSNFLAKIMLPRGQGDTDELRLEDSMTGLGLGAAGNGTFQSQRKNVPVKA